MRRWNELQEDFRSLVFERGVDKVAAEIPTHRATVYRLVNGDTKRPSMALCAGIERVLQNQETDDRPNA